MNRRQFTINSLAVSGVIVAGVALRRATMDHPAIQAAIDQLAALRQMPLRGSGTWTPYQVFTHIAQSIDYSMTGYPELKSPLFRNTAGRAAFFAFSTAGAMRHNLAEPIPGAPTIAPTGSAVNAIGRVISSLKAFADYRGPLQPHFAYGDLSKEEYADAHLMHIRTHMQEISA